MGLSNILLECNWQSTCTSETVSVANPEEVPDESADWSRVMEWFVAKVRSYAESNTCEHMGCGSRAFGNIVEYFGEI